MSTPSQPTDESQPSDEARAEAAVWIARLHDEQRSATLDARVHAWLEESEAHRHAFDRITRVWECTAGLDLHAPFSGRVVGDRRWKPRHSVMTLLAVFLFGAAVMTTRLWHGNSVVTEVGQQQVRLLPDGTRLMLNTDTQVEVNYDRDARRVRLVHGEAWFDVSKRPTWPFIVNVEGREIRALGTSFVVRHDDIQALSVTLVEGRISISTRSGGGISQPTETLAPGQRISFSHNLEPAIDQPEIGRVTAWERGRVEFEDTPLGDAAQEMNRYSKAHIIIADPDIARLRIGGVFRAGDSDEFVRIAAVALTLKVEQRRGQYLLRPANSER
jgi:transmembrane sensor